MEAVERRVVRQQVQSAEVVALVQITDKMVLRAFQIEAVVAAVALEALAQAHQQVLAALGLYLFATNFRHRR